MKLSYLSSFRERHKHELQEDELDKRLLELSALFELSKLLNASLDLKNILDNILLIPMGRMMLSRGLVLLKKNDNVFEVVNAKGMPSNWLNKQLTIDQSFSDPQKLSELKNEEQWAQQLKEQKIDLLLPIVSQGYLKGYIAFSKKLNGQPFNQDEIDFLFSLSNIAGQAIQNALMFLELKQVNRQLDQKIQELNTLFEIGKELNQIFDEKTVLKQLSFSLMGQMLVNQFFIVLKKDDHWQVAFRQGSFFSEERCQKTLDICQALTEHQEPIPVNEDCRFDILKKLGVKLVVPMLIKNHVQGFIFLGPRLDQKPYNQLHLEFIHTLANIAMISLENARLIQETIEKERLEEELSIARNIQNRLLPTSFPRVNVLDFHGLNIPSKQVGGDYFDVIRLNEQEIVFTIADVSGKGIPAALLMSNLQAGLHILLNEQYTLAEITTKLNLLIFKNTSVERFITFFILKLNTVSGHFEYVNAGHNPPILLRNDGQVELLETGGLILGVFDTAVYEMGKGQMKSGDFLTMYTDGVTESMDSAQNDFSEERLIQLIKKNAPALTCEQFNHLLVQEVKRFSQSLPQSDDITLLSIKRL